ncbi:hypothetical protein [Emcibacter nanhaiensis]|uniref:Uncharacterized protein n=1 Tax=Emcibacter nanhaiensis TaxID=1505037 RepID=A0A501PTR0_9PROT|nr:hypothetical protein [Emcibacter nanhaiensis]TPD63166.1 hypothetical protein FIV46_03560 [Emcibacter nanhaiensis]
MINLKYDNHCKHYKIALNILMFSHKDWCGRFFEAIEHIDSMGLKDWPDGLYERYRKCAEGVAKLKEQLRDRGQTEEDLKTQFYDIGYEFSDIYLDLERANQSSSCRRTLISH